MKNQRQRAGMFPAEQIVNRYLTHVKHHDVEAALDCLSEGFELEFAGAGYTMPKGVVADALGWDAGAEGRLEWRVVSAGERRVTDGLSPAHGRTLAGLSPPVARMGRWQVTSEPAPTDSRPMGELRCNG